MTAGKRKVRNIQRGGKKNLKSDDSRKNGKERDGCKAKNIT